MTDCDREQQCGHPVECIVSSDEGTHYCLRCALEAAYESHQNWLEALVAYEDMHSKSNTKRHLGDTEQED